MPSLLRASLRRPLRRTALALAAATVLGPMAVAPAAAAATCTWNAAAGNWNALADWANCVAGNGNPAGSPGAADTAIIGAAGVVTVNTQQSVLNLNNAGQVNIDAFGLNLVGGGSTTNTGVINVGSAVTANLGVAAGHNITNTGGVINIANGSVLNQFGSTITGGTINTTGTGAVVGQSNNSNVLSNVTLNGTLDLATVASARERITNGATINGAVNIANGGILGLDAGQTLGGTVSVNLNDANAHLSLDGTGSTTLGAGVTVRGQGSIGPASFAGGSIVLTNQGTISADVNGGTLTITPPANSGSLVNQGTLQATGGGMLVLSTVTNNAGGLISAQNGSVVRQNGVAITGGTLTTAGTGVIQAISSGSNVLDGVSFSGTLDLSTVASAREQIANGATINGVVNIANGGILGLNSGLTAGGSQTLAGTVTINLNDANAHLSIDGTGSTTLGAGVTVRGQGSIGTASFLGGTNALTNNGLISADVGGGTLNIVAPGNSGSFLNNGTLQAVNGATLQLSTSINNAGQIIAGAGSTVVQSGVTLNGLINAGAAGASLRVISSGINFLDGVNFTGTLDLSTIATSREQIVNGATINGAVNIANGGILGLNSQGGNQSLLGTVSINLNDPNAHLSIDGNGSTTLGAGVTVHGQGNIGAAAFQGGVNALTNNGLISSDVNGGTLVIVAPANGGSFLNNATLQAVNGATLQLSTSINNAGQIIAGAGSTVVQNGVTLNGLINAGAAGASLQVTNSGVNFLDGVNFTGALDMTTVATSREQIINGATINGVVNIANGGILGLNSLGGSQTLGGTVVINLNDQNARLSIDSNGSTTLGAGVTVRGQGNIGTAAFTGGVNALTNNGLISADVSGGTLSITPPANGGSFTNNATLQAVNGGRLNLSSSINNNAGGLISAQNGSTVVQNGVTLSGGTLASSGTGAFQAISSNSNVLTNVTLNGTLDMTSFGSSREQIVGSAIINGAVNIANGGILSLNSVGGAVTIGGTGVINLNDANARLSIDSNGSTTLGAGVTVRGQGNIGQAIFAGGSNALINNGTIVADGGTLLIAAPANNGALSGTGTLQVSGGAMNLNTGVASTQGKLVIGAAGTLNLNAQNLTITNDYTNGQWGSGNSFAARAGVSGTGQILAGGGATQVLVGSNITGGNTNNATLTIGNVHVGANTFDYQVTDSSASGPILRGGLQTSVNGANLNDGRLSGSGVTASNYSSSNGPLTVTYTAASAGAQSALAGQVLNLTSNFGNIADQKLNIVLGAAAAAYNLASGSTAAVAVANQRVGGSNTAALAVSNAAPGGAFTEVLNASFAGSSGNVTSTNGAIAGGTGSGVAGGASNATAMTVGIDTTTAGAKSGTATLNYVSNGTGSSGLGNTAVGSQAVNVTGNVYNAAVGAATPSPINFGNVHVNAAVSQVLTVSNTAASGSFSEALNASFSGASGSATGAGSLSNLAAGASNSAAMSVGLNTTSAGAKLGSVTVAYQTDGTGSNGNSGLAAAAAGSQTVNVTGAVYNLASSNVIAPINLVAHTGDGGGSVSQTLTITNTAAAGAFSEGLNSSFGGFTPGGGNTINPTLSGSITNLAAGSTDNSSMKVAISTAVAGVFNGTVTVDQASNGATTSGLGITGLASQQVAASGGVTVGVFNLAAPTVNNAQPIDFGNVRIATAVANQALSISNTAPVSAFTEVLNGSVVSASAPFTASGSFSGLQAGAAPNTNISVGMNTGSAGHQTGNVVLGFVSDGTGIAGNGTTTPLNNQNVALVGNVYQVAQPTIAAVDLGATRAGGSLTGAVHVTNTLNAPVGYQEGLDATVKSSTGLSAAGGSITNLAAGASDAASITVGLGAATAGLKSGTVTLGLQSNGTGTSGLANFVLADSSAIAVTGKVYQTAVLNVATASPTIDFGIVRVGSAVNAQTITISNAAQVTPGYNDTLNATVSGLSGPLSSAANNIAALVAGGGSGTAAVSLLATPGSAGVYSQTAHVGSLSQDGVLADVDGGSADVTVKAQINNLANAVFSLASGAGTVSGNGSHFTLDLGNVFQGTNLAESLSLTNATGAGPADDLLGVFDLSNLAGFSAAGWNPADLAANATEAGLGLQYSALNLGAFSGSITFNASSFNTSQGALGLGPITIDIIGDVIQQGVGNVPEPGTLALLLAAAAAGWTTRRRPAAARRVA